MIGSPGSSIRFSSIDPPLNQRCHRLEEARSSGEIAHVHRLLTLKPVCSDGAMKGCSMCIVPEQSSTEAMQPICPQRAPPPPPSVAAPLPYAFDKPSVGSNELCLHGGQTQSAGGRPEQRKRHQCKGSDNRRPQTFDLQPICKFSFNSSSNSHRLGSEAGEVR